MEKTYATTGKVFVVVHNEVGLVALTAHAGTSVHVALEAERPDAEELVEQATVDCRHAGGRDVVVVKIPRLHGMRFVRRNGVTVRIALPRGSDVEVVTASANVELNGSLGAVSVKTASGEVTADDVDDLRAKTASGDIEVGTVGGDLRLHTASGDLRCVRVDGRSSVTTTSGDAEIGSTGGGIEVRATSGDVRLGEVSGEAKVVAVSGDVHVLSLAEGSAHIRSVSGDIEVGIAPGVTFSVDAETLSGTLESAIPLHDAPGAHGDPAIALTVRSVSGNVSIERGLAVA
jgi:DUF4097 and DUF4098 domain-containing protein YvlB